MNQHQQQAIESTLQATLEDSRLAKDEERTLRDAIEAFADDREALAFIRNCAFKLARQRIEASPVDVLRWLERIDKIVDNTVSPPQRGGTDHGIALAFSPGEDGLELIQREIRACKESLDICVFTITDDRVTNAILDAHRRGVTVRLVTDNDKQFDDGSDIKRMVREGVPTRFDPDRDHMHHKFAIVDSKRLITGSYNWTRGATRNHENITVLTDADLIQAFCKEFNRLWSDFNPR
jgi:phosphatidylserine/phosphatidylglycerophosphate/cardiolipin synthase-like enzyme